MSIPNPPATPPDALGIDKFPARFGHQILFLRGFFSEMQKVFEKILLIKDWF